MASEIKANKISPATGTAFTLGDSGDTFTIPSGVTLTNNGSSSGFDSGLASVQTFTSSGTWTKPSGITKVIIEVQGGGSSGTDGNVGNARNTHGGSGGYAKKLIDVSSISSATITVGAGGAGVTSFPSNAGGDSIWSDGTNTVTGGGAGVAGTANYTGGVGGTASGGDLNINGRHGGGYFVGAGGDSIVGFGGTYGTTSPSTNSFEPTGYGSGSVGLYGNGTTKDAKDGIVIVWEYK